MAYVRGIPSPSGTLIAVLGLAAVLGGPSVGLAARRQAVAVSSLAPACAEAGAHVTIAGSGLRKVRAVSVGAARAAIVQKRADAIAFVVPEGAAPGFVTVELRARRRARRVLASHGLRIGCSGELRIVADTARAAEAEIGPEGGRLEVVTAAGLSLALVVPADALAATETIRVTPLTQVSGLPFSGGLVAAARFEPDGLRFAVPATLRIALPAGAAARPLLGFRFEGSGAGLVVVPVRIADGVLELAVPHFSGGGAASGAATDFAAAIAPYLSQLGTLSLGLMDELLDLQAVWLEMFPDFCDTPAGQPLCEQVRQTILDSIADHVATFCPAPPAPLPFVSEEAIRQVVELQAVANRLGVDAVDATVRACLHEITAGLIADARAAALQFARRSRIARLIELAALAQTIGFEDLVDAAFAAAIEALRKLVADAVVICGSDPLAGTDLIVSAVDLLADSAELEAAVTPDVSAGFAGCRVVVHVLPDEVTVSVGSGLQFTAVIQNLRRQDVVFNVSGLATIGAGGAFTATLPGSFVVTATSAVWPTIEGIAGVEVVQTTSTTTPTPPQPTTTAPPLTTTTTLPCLCVFGNVCCQSAACCDGPSI